MARTFFRARSPRSKAAVLFRDELGRKRCRECEEFKVESEFSGAPNNSDGLMTRCKACDRAKTARQRKENFKDPRGKSAKKMLSSAAERARKKNVPFGLYTPGEGVQASRAEAVGRILAMMGERCPISGKKWVYTKDDGQCTPGPHSPSLDRKDPAKGYVWDNIQVIAFDINSFKGSRTQEQFEIDLDALLAFREENSNEVLGSGHRSERSG